MQYRFWSVVVLQYWNKNSNCRPNGSSALLELIFIRDHSFNLAGCDIQEINYMLSAICREWVVFVVFVFDSSRLMFFFLVLFHCTFCVLVFVYLSCTNKDNNNNNSRQAARMTCQTTPTCATPMDQSQSSRWQPPNAPPQLPNHQNYTSKKLPNSNCQTICTAHTDAWKLVVFNCFLRSCA